MRIGEVKQRYSLKIRQDKGKKIQQHERVNRHIAGSCPSEPSKA